MGIKDDETKAWFRDYQAAQDKLREVRELREFRREHGSKVHRRCTGCKASRTITAAQAVKNRFCPRCGNIEVAIEPKPKVKPCP